MLRRSIPTALVLTGALLSACSDSDEPLVGPAAPVLTPPATVSVTVEYRQPNGCINVATPCDEPVVFFGSWMQQGGEFQLRREPGAFVWRGTAHAVPVNWPPRDDPYQVRVFDPHLREGYNQGYVADRIILGGEALLRLDGGGGPSQHALAYVDDNGRGHNPY